MLTSRKQPDKADILPRQMFSSIFTQVENVPNTFIKRVYGLDSKLESTVDLMVTDRYEYQYYLSFYFSNILDRIPYHAT